MSHLRALRRHSVFGSLKIFFLPECNLGEEHAHIARWIVYEEQISNLVIPRWGKDNKIGFPTSNESKESGFHFLDTVLACNTLRFMQNMIVTNPFVLRQSDMTVKKLEANIQKEFIKQLAQMRLMFIVSENPGVLPRVIVTGKCNNRGKVSKFMQDDLVLCLFIALCSHNIIVRQRNRRR